MLDISATDILATKNVMVDVSAKTINCWGGGGGGRGGGGGEGGVMHLVYIFLLVL